MKIYCVFFLSFFSFIILIYKILSAEEIKYNKLDKIFEKYPKISSNTIDNFVCDDIIDYSDLPAKVCVNGNWIN